APASSTTPSPRTSTAGTPTSPTSPKSYPRSPHSLDPLVRESLVRERWEPIDGNLERPERPERPLMTRTWLSIRVELVEGHGEHFWPRPGRIFAAARTHTFAQLATAIDDAFARWDRAHLHEFDLADGTR